MCVEGSSSRRGGLGVGGCDTGHKALMPGVTLRRPGIPVGPGAWDWAYLWVPALGLGIPVGPGACGSRRLLIGISYGRTMLVFSVATTTPPGACHHQPGAL
eukprot:COSAG02_NODE_8872_length_2415_cov_22.702504_4_plen_100_part_01